MGWASVTRVCRGTRFVVSRGCVIAAPVPTIEPTSAAAGDTWTWSRAFPDYPASEYTLSYAIRGVTRLDWDSDWVTTSGDGFVVTIPAASTVDLGAGTYRWVANVTDIATGLERWTAGSGILTVTPNYDAYGDGDAQTHNEKMLALIESALEERVTGVADGGRGTVENYAVEGRQVSLIPTEQLNILRNKYRRAVWKERNPGVATPQALIKFVRA